MHDLLKDFILGSGTIESMYVCWEGGNAFNTPIICMDGMDDWKGLLLVVCRP